MQSAVCVAKNHEMLLTIFDFMHQCYEGADPLLNLQETREKVKRTQQELMELFALPPQTAFDKVFRQPQSRDKIANDQEANPE